MFLDEDFLDENDHLSEDVPLATSPSLSLPSINNNDNVQTEQQQPHNDDDDEDLDHLRNYDSGSSSDNDDDDELPSSGRGSGISRSHQTHSAPKYLNLSAHCMFIENIHPHRKINNAYIMAYLCNFNPKSAKRVYRDCTALDRAIVEFHFEADMLDCIRQLNRVDRAPLNPCSKIRVRVATQRDRRLFTKSGSSWIGKKRKKKKKRRKNKTHNEDTMLKRNDYSLQELMQVHAKRDAQMASLQTAQYVNDDSSDNSGNGNNSSASSPIQERRAKSIREILHWKKMRAKNLDLVVQVLQSRVYNPQGFEQLMESLLDAANTNRTEADEGSGGLSNDDSEWMKQFVVEVRQMDNGKAERDLITSQAELQLQQQQKKK